MEHNRRAASVCPADRTAGAGAGGGGISARELAADAGVNPNTMQRALQDLESRGLLQAQRTAGRTVTANDTVLQALRRKRAATLARDFLQQMHALGMTAAEVETLLRETETSEKE